MSVSEYVRFQLRKLTGTEPRSLDELDEPAASDEARAAA
jgi:Arc/MetJ-type ribon-helix-helix transcriptional regulator